MANRIEEGARLKGQPVLLSFYPNDDTPVGSPHERRCCGRALAGPEPNASRKGTQVENLCYGGQRGAARAQEPALMTSEAMDGGAKSASSERRAGCPQRASGDGRGQARALCEPERHTG
jgi:hypothetical protein